MDEYTSRGYLLSRGVYSNIILVANLLFCYINPNALDVCIEINGGIANGQDAYDYIRAGVSLVQLYTALVYEGPSVVRKICDSLSQLLKKDGLTLRDAIGIDNCKNSLKTV